MRHYDFQTVSTSQIPAGVDQTVKVNGHRVMLTQQPTGFGAKRLFLCPSCGKRCAKLVLYKDTLYCRGCAPFDVNYYRRNIYDEGGQRLIVWNMWRVAGTAGISLTFPFKYWNHIDHMLSTSRKQEDALREMLRKLQMLENMRFCSIFFGQRFTPARIRKYTRPDFLTLFELWQIEKYCIFTGRYRPEEALLFMADRPERFPYPCA